jgi:hypothetical protein
MRGTGLAHLPPALEGRGGWRRNSDPKQGTAIGTRPSHAVRAVQANRPVTEAGKLRPDRFDIDALRRALGEVELPGLGDPGRSGLYDGRIPEPGLAQQSGKRLAVVHP